MKTLKSLNQAYQKTMKLENQYRKSLMNYLNEALAFCKDGIVELSFKYKHWQDAEKAGVEFTGQFPVSITIEDRHGFQHSIYDNIIRKPAPSGAG